MRSPIAQPEVFRLQSVAGQWLGGAAVWLGLMGMWAGTANAVQVAYTQDFDSQTVGNTVTGFTSVFPAIAIAGDSGRGAVVVNQSPGDNAMRVYDYDPAPSSGNVRVQQDFTPLQLVRFGIDFQRNADIAVNPSTESTRALYLALGYNGLGLETGANRLLEIRLYNNGQFRINRGLQLGDGSFDSAALSTAGTFEPSGTTYGAHSLEVFANSGLPGEAPYGFVGPDLVYRLLDPNSFAVFLNGVRIDPGGAATANGNFGVFQSSLYPVSTGFGRMSLISGGSSAVTGVDFVVDNFRFSEIPEAPLGWGVLSGIGSLVIWRRWASRGRQG